MIFVVVFSSAFDFLINYKYTNKKKGIRCLRHIKSRFYREMETGPEVVVEGLKVLNAVAEKFGFAIETKDFDWGGDRYLVTGNVLPDDAGETLKQFDSVFLGAIGHPDVKPGILEKGILLKLRFELDQYINLRPVKLYPGVETPLAGKTPEDIDYVVVRENTGGIYTGVGGNTMKGTKDEVAVQSMVYNHMQVERCIVSLLNKR